MPHDVPTPLVERLQSFGQSHVLRYWDELDSSQRQRLLTQLAAVDLELIARLVAGDDEKIDFAGMARRSTASW